MTVQPGFRIPMNRRHFLKAAAAAPAVACLPLSCTAPAVEKLPITWSVLLRDFDWAPYLVVVGELRKGGKHYRHAARQKLARRGKYAEHDVAQLKALVERWFRKNVA